MNYCTSCGKEFEKEKIILNLYLACEIRIKKSWESIENSEIINREILCRDCFERFSSLYKDFLKK